MLQTGQDIITTALVEIQALKAPGENPTADELTFCLNKLNRLLDRWNAQSLFKFTNNFTNFTLVPNLAPHTIGQGAYITATSITSNVATYVSKNSFQNQDSISVLGSTHLAGIFNVSASTITNATSTQFQVALTHANAGSVAEPAVCRAALAYNGVPTFITPGNRPNKMVAANLVINNVTPSYTIPLNIRDADWWAGQRVQSLTTSYPTDVYYEPDWPNGSLFFWPVPTTAWPVQLEMWTTLLYFPTLTTSFSLPPAYWDAIIYNLAVSLCPAFGRQVDPNLALEARESKAQIKSLNAVPPRISTGGDGLPTGARRPTFDWRTGLSR